jgi:hypothetical protein
MEHLENHLRSWVPRRPSAKLERRLFGTGLASAAGGAHSAVPAIPHPATYLRWLIPATVAMILVFMTFSQPQVGIATEPISSGHFLALLSSNQRSASIGKQHNRVAKATFEDLDSFGTEARYESASHLQRLILSSIFHWTNDSGLTSSVRFLLGPKAQH